MAKKPTYKELEARIAALELAVSEKEQAEGHRKKSEEQFRSLFEDSPVPLIETDFSELKHLFTELRESGIRNFRRYFRAHPKDAVQAGRLVKTINANQAAVEAFKAESREMLIEGFTQLGGKIFQKDWVNIVIALAEGKHDYQKDIRLHTFKGDIRDFTVKWTVPEASRSTLDRVYTAHVDITARKKMCAKFFEVNI